MRAVCPQRAADDGARGGAPCGATGAASALSIRPTMRSGSSPITGGPIRITPRRLRRSKPTPSIALSPKPARPSWPRSMWKATNRMSCAGCGRCCGTIGWCSRSNCSRSTAGLTSDVEAECGLSAFIRSARISISPMTKRSAHLNEAPAALSCFEPAPHSITISPTMPCAAWLLPSLPTMPQRRSVTRPAATGTNHHSAAWPG